VILPENVYFNTIHKDCTKQFFSFAKGFKKNNTIFLCECKITLPIKLCLVEIQLARFSNTIFLLTPDQDKYSVFGRLNIVFVLLSEKYLEYGIEITANKNISVCKLSN
jgi:hypothetical protein